MEQIFGTLERITYRQEESGFTVARLKQPRKKDLTTIVGTLPHLSVGDTLRLIGNWKKHPSHGMQLEVSECYFDSPKDCEGIERYLGSGAIRGIGPSYAKRIVERFKEASLDIIEHATDQLLSIEGIGEKRLEQIKKSWGQQKAIRDIMVFLQKHTVSPGYARKIYRQYGEETVERLQENPYALANDIIGIGFKIADTIANKMGFPSDSTLRLDAGIAYVLNELASSGHTCYPKEALCLEGETLLGHPIQERMQVGITEERFIEHEGRIWLKKYWLCEKAIARDVNRILEAKSALRDVKLDPAINWVEEKLNLKLADKQKEAVKAALSEKMVIITGGPGTGKSTITNAILTITSRLTHKILLAAPTGRAAKRMSEITRREALTIHSMLKFDFKEKRFKHNKDYPLPCDLLIVDEASMLDTPLATSLFAAIGEKTRVILVGDVFQLPSVGPGTVLNDLIECDKIPVVTLNEIYRQAAGSKIVTNAHKVNAGDFPDLSFDKESDFFFCKAEEPTAALNKVVELVSKRLSKRFHPIKHIQVLAPMKKGELGIDNLNQALAKALNPDRSETMRFSVGDKVMQLRNDYDKEVYNGDIGVVSHIEEHVTITFDGHEVDYDKSELEDLTLAYATSVHKYQGSECPCVVIVVHPAHFMMLQRNLLYTAITRGKKLVILVGTGKAIGMAVGRNDAEKRHTGLKEAMRPQLLPADLPA